MACADVGIDIKTYRRWCKCVSDLCKGPKSSPANKLSDEERALIIATANSEEYRDLSPTKIVPMLADEGKHIASESTIYRIVKEEKILKHRGHSEPKSYKKPKELIATAPNTIYSWDITYLPTLIAGKFYYLYFFMDVFNRKVVGYEVHESESSECASQLIKKICQDENLTNDERKALYLHSDNRAPMKGATMLAMLQDLGVMPSFSRPRVSDDNPYSESLFKTLKYCPQYPSKPFATIEKYPCGKRA